MKLGEDYQLITAGVFIRPEVLSEEPKVTKAPIITKRPVPDNDNEDQESEGNEENETTENIVTDTSEDGKGEEEDISNNNITLIDDPEEEAIKSKDKNKVIKLQITSFMYYLAPGILFIGTVLELAIAYMNRKIIFAYITQLWYTLTDLMIIGAAVYSLLSKPTEFNCKISLFVSLVALGNLSMANFLMTWYKFVLIRFPVGRMEMTTVKKQVIWCVCSFVGIVVLSSPILWAAPLSEHLITARRFCNFTGDEYIYFVVAWLTVCLVLPLFFNLCMYLLIGLKVVQHKKKTRARKSQFLPVTQVTVVSTAPEEDDSAEKGTLLRKIPKSMGKKCDNQIRVDEPKTPKFPPIIVVSMVITIGTYIPFIPALLNPSWFYSKNKLVLDIIYSVMLLCIAVSPFVHLGFSKRTKETLGKIKNKLFCC